MTSGYSLANSESQVLRQFLQLAQAPLRQLLNRCQFSIGLIPTGESALIIDCNSKDVKALGHHVRSLASLAVTVGSQWIFVRCEGQHLHAFNTNLIHALEFYNAKGLDLATTSVPHSLTRC